MTTPQAMSGTLAGWKVEQDTSLGDAMFSVTGKVKNTSETTSTAFIHFKFIDKSGEVLGNVQCNSADLEPGQTQAPNCIPDGKYRKYKRVTARSYLLTGCLVRMWLTRLRVRLASTPV